MKQCPHCLSINASAARFCAGCGAELARQCDACGRQPPTDARFCPYCGTSLLNQQPTAGVRPHLPPEVRLALYSLTHSLGITFLLLAAVTIILTPPPRIWDELFLLAIGGGLVMASRLFKTSGQNGRPPGGNRPRAAGPLSPGGYEIILPDDDEIEVEAGRHPPNLPPPGSTQGPYLN